MEYGMRRKLLAPLLVATMLATGYATLAHGQTPAQTDRGDTLVRTEMAYPTGDRATSVLLLERFTPAETRAGQSFEYRIKLTNLTNMEIQDLVLTEQYPPTLRVSAVSPEPDSARDGFATWSWDKLAPRESTVLRLRGSTNNLETLTYCAKVTFATVACASMRVVQPELVLTKTAPADVLLCEQIPLRFTVRNAGTGVARNVRITDRLPDGWTTEDGRTTLVADAGDLAAGQSREFTATVRSANTGQFTNTATATEDGGLTADATAMTAVRKPVLVLTKRGPEYRFVGRPATFQITVSNEGDAPADNTVLFDSLPAGTQFMSATNDGQLSGDQVSWNLGTLMPGASRSVEVTLKANQRGTIRNAATAQAVCAQASAPATLEIRGIPAILLEVIDLADPIEAGSNETYEITVLNQGSADGTNIRIACTLPPEQQYISSTGPTTAQVDGSNVSFLPLRSLGPKATATYRVIVKGVTVGDVRFKVSLTSDQMTSPAEETESTHIY